MLDQSNLNGESGISRAGIAAVGDLDRKVIRCKSCGLVQFRTRSEICRRCQRRLPPRAKFLILPPRAAEGSRDEIEIFTKQTNLEAVEKIGRRIQQLRKAKGMTQKQLQNCSYISRSYLARIESGLVTPSLGTVEKISVALDVGLNRFFLSDLCDTLLEDKFIQGLRPFLHQLDWEQWQSILKRLAAISNHVSNGSQQMHPLERSQAAQIA